MVEADDKKGVDANGNSISQSTIVDSSAASGQLTRRTVENNKRKITDYHLLRVIGTGTFGKVYLALLDGQPVALKALKKTQIINLKQVDHIKLEKSLLAQIYHPFIVNL